jgi:glycogen synthase kinase 3 beta
MRYSYSDDKFLYIVTDRHSSSLDHLIEKRSLNQLLIKCFVWQLFRGLAFIHAKGVLHRDIKPANLLATNAHLVICDFGNAKLNQEE